MDRELEALRQAKGLGAPLGDADVRLKLFEEGSNIADIIDALVETARELGRQGLDGNTRIGQGGEDDDEFGGLWGMAVSSIDTSVTKSSPFRSLQMRR